MPAKDIKGFEGLYKVMSGQCKSAYGFTHVEVMNG